MNILIMRHGDANRSAPSDAERTLTGKGKQSVFDVSQSLKADGFEIECLISSPYTRALETAGIVSDVLGLQAQIIQCQDITPDSPPHIAISSLDKLLKPNTLIVSHLPLVSFLIAQLIGDHGNNGVPMTTSACAWLTGEVWGDACLDLKSLRDPVSI